MASQEIPAKLTEGGRIVIPAEYRRALNIEIGDELFIRLKDSELQILSKKEALRRAQELVKSYAGTRSLTSELIEERRLEVQKEGSQTDGNF